MYNLYNNVIYNNILVYKYWKFNLESLEKKFKNVYSIYIIISFLILFLITSLLYCCYVSYDKLKISCSVNFYKN